MTKYRSDVAELAKRLGIHLPAEDEAKRLIRPILEGDRDDLEAEANEWKEDD